MLNSISRSVYKLFSKKTLTVPNVKLFSNSFFKHFLFFYFFMPFCFRPFAIKINMYLFAGLLLFIAWTWPLNTKYCSKLHKGTRDVCIMDHRWRVISIQQKLMKLNNCINFITEDSTHEVPEASRGPSASKASNNIISFRENGCQSVFSQYCSVLPLH